MGFFDTFSKLKDGLAKTRNTIVDRVKNLILLQPKIDINTISQLEEILLTSDVGFETTEIIIKNLKEKIKKNKIENSNEILNLLQEEITSLLNENFSQKNNESQKPYVVLIVGVNGVGKTTSIGKLANYFSQQGKKVLISSCDTFRAAANEQLTIWAKRANAEIVQQQQGSDPAAVAFDSVSSAIAKNYDVVLIDTAGRLHTNVNLMEELKKISRVIKKIISNAPHDIFLILDASMGQNSIQQATIFTSSTDVTGIILTKLDGTAKGGVVLSIQKKLKIPVKYIGVGESIDDLQEFNPTNFSKALIEIL